MTIREQKELYSQRAIGIATFFGGPLAAGILVRRNYINLGNESYGKHALSIGIISTIILFGGLFSIPEHVLDQMPGSILPAIYTIIIYFTVDKFQGKQLKEHKNGNGVFYSAWKATGVGFVCMLLIIAGVFGYVYTLGDDFDTERYDKGLAEFFKNEETALGLFELDEASPKREVTSFINRKGIPNWEKNMRILNDLDRIEGLTDQFKRQNEILREYCTLRIQSYRIIEKAILEETDKYGSEIEMLNKKIEEQISKLEKN